MFECFYMYMGAYIQINAAVFITMCGVPARNTLVLCIPGPFSPRTSVLTCLRAWVTVFQFKYM